MNPKRTITLRPPMAQPYESRDDLTTMTVGKSVLRRFAILKIGMGAKNADVALTAFMDKWEGKK